MQDSLRQQLSDQYLDTISNSIGAQREQTRRGVDLALPELLKQLKQNAGTREGRLALEKAIQRDHDGSVLDRLQDQFKNPDQGDGAAILKHVFGDREAGIAQHLGARSGIGAGGMSKILVALAPVVLGMLGKKMKGGGGLGGLGDIFSGGGRSSRGGCLGMLLPLVTKFLTKR